MMNKFILALKSKIYFLLIIISLGFIFNTSFASNVIYNGTSNSFGPRVLKYNLLTVTGDSFAGKFVTYEDGKELKLFLYAVAGQTVSKNLPMMLTAVDAKPKCILVSIGVNDQYQETMPYNFESNMRKVVTKAKGQNKIVFFHSFLKYFSNTGEKARFDATYYDNVLKRLAYEYDNVIYFDVHDLENPIFISEDAIHYNKAFYDILYSRIYDKMYELQDMLSLNK